MKEKKKDSERTTCSLWINLLQSCSNFSGQKIALLHCIRQHTINYASGPYVHKLDCKRKGLCALTCAWIQGCTDVRENGHMHHFCSCILIYMHGYSTLYVWVMFFFNCSIYIILQWMNLTYVHIEIYRNLASA